MKKLIGTIGVDSGQIMIIDPCYIDGSWDESSYDECCTASLSKNRFGAVKSLFAICSSTAYGDGEYPVYAEVDKDGMITSVHIDFIKERGDY